MNNMEKFKKIRKEQGVFAALFKSAGYFIFLAKKKKLEKIWKDVRLASGKIIIGGWNTGPKIYWDGVELTKGAGINTSVFVNGKWHDSSKASWKSVSAGPGRLVLKNTWNSISVKQIWVLSDAGDGKISCNIDMETGKDIEFIEQKFTIMISEKFNLWSDAENKSASFPAFGSWVDVKEVKKNSVFISAHSNIEKNIPSVAIKKQDPESKVYPQIQNSDFKTKSRLLNFVASSRDMDLKYKKGVNKFFNIEIDIK